MYNTPKITPLSNLEESVKTLKNILLYKKNNWAIGQSYPAGGPDAFTYFFSIRCIPIFNYLRGEISIGEPTAYNKNLKELAKYINYSVSKEIALIDEAIIEIKIYEKKNWAIGEMYPDGGPDKFVIFFGKRELTIAPYLRGTVDIGTPEAYKINIETLLNYRKKIKNFYIK